MRRSGRTGAVLALAGLVLAGLAGWFARVEGHWSVDSAVWELMTREVARRGWDGLWVRNLAQEVDPEGRFFPGFFFVRRGDRYHFSFQPAFALLTAPFYRALGRAGTAVLPVAAALLLAWVVARGTDALVPGWGWVGATAVLFLTPVPLYAATVWNHLPSVALLTLGALLAWRSGVEGNWRPSGVFLAGASVGSALLFRNEAYVYFAALLVAWVLSTPGPPRTWPYGDFRGPGTASLGGSPGPVSRETLGGAAVGPRWLGAVLLVAGFAAGWSLQAGLNWQLFGSAFGPKAESVAARQASGAVDLGYRLWNAYLFLAAPDFGAFLRGGVERGLLLFAPVVLAGLVLALPGVEGRGKAAATALWAVAAADVAVLAGRTQVTGFFWVAPYLVVSVLHRPLTPTRTFLGTLAVLFAAGGWCGPPLTEGSSGARGTCWPPTPWRCGWPWTRGGLQDPGFSGPCGRRWRCWGPSPCWRRPRGWTTRTRASGGQHRPCGRSGACPRGTWWWGLRSSRGTLPPPTGKRS
jgi:hypothetical protein